VIGGDGLNIYSVGGGYDHYIVMLYIITPIVLPGVCAAECRFNIIVCKDELRIYFVVTNITENTLIIDVNYVSRGRHAYPIYTFISVWYPLRARHALSIHMP
jgi:hypothetical protein